MVHKGKNTENQWSIIAPSGNKIKMLITPFGTFSDSIKFFNNSLADMATNMIDEDINQLYQLHYSYFTTSTRFKSVTKRRQIEKNPFTLKLFKTMFKGKLLFPYESMNDLDWLFINSTVLTGIEEFMSNTMGKETPLLKSTLAWKKYTSISIVTPCQIFYIFILWKMAFI